MNKADDMISKSKLLTAINTNPESDPSQRVAQILECILNAETEG